MNIYVDFNGILSLFQQVQTDNRSFLFEHEVYELVRLSGSETVPKHIFIPKGTRLEPELFQDVPGEKIVLKIVSPYITHKSDIGGVRIVPKDPEHLLSAVRRMLYEVPENYATQMARFPEYAPPVYRGLKGEALLSAVARDIRGVLLCQYMPITSEFGSELLLSLRRSREFGMIISAGLGGTDTELYAASLRKGQAVVAASTAMTDGDTFFRLFQDTISYKVLAGKTRGHARIVTDEQLQECFAAFIALGNAFSVVNDQTPFVIEELEFNPFAFTDYLMVPLDGLCRFSTEHASPVPRPVNKIKKLLHPQSIGVIGVSAKEMNVGRIILNNILVNGFEASRLRVIHPSAQQIDGVTSIPSLDVLEDKLDLLIVAVNAQQVPVLLEQVLDGDRVNSVILVPGGIGEVYGSEQQSRQIRDAIQQAHLRPDGGPIFLGANSLGILSHPGHYDSMFIPETLLPKHRGDYARHSALISQSGGYLITRMSNMPLLDPAYGIAIGNQFDLTISDMVNALNSNDDMHIFAVYVEGFNDLDGLEFARSVRDAVLRGKEVIFYKAGRTPEGKTATSGHTASIAGDYMVCESCVQQAGAMVAHTFTEFNGLLALAEALHGKNIGGNRLAAISNAGYEAVGMADNIEGDDYKLELVPLAGATRETIARTLRQANLEELVNVKNPLDLTPMADEAVYDDVTRVLLEDHSVDLVMLGITPLTPMIQGLDKGRGALDFLTAEQGIVGRLATLSADYNKPLVVVIDSGAFFDYLAEAFQQSGVPVFRSADRAMRTLGRYVQGRLRAQRLLANSTL